MTRMSQCRADNFEYYLVFFALQGKEQGLKFFALFFIALTTKALDLSGHGAQSDESECRL